MNRPGVSVIKARRLLLVMPVTASGVWQSAPAFYYARVFQVDGEMAWSSPIWVS